MKNPYKNATFVTKAGEEISQLRLGHSRQAVVANNGDINATDKQDLLRQIGHLVVAASRGETKKVEEASVIADRRLHRELILAAHNEPNKTHPNSKWAKMGVEIAAAIEQNSAREGFMRSLLVEEPVTQGERPQARMKYLNVVAVVASGPADVAPQLVRDKTFFPPEFYIEAHLEVEDREIQQLSADILDEKYTEGLQAMMTQEDRLVKIAMDMSIGNFNDLTALAGGLTPATLSALKWQVGGWKLPVQTCLMSFDYWNDITGNTDMMSLLDPVTKFDLVQTGQLGQLLGMQMMTDGYRQPELQVLQSGEIYILAPGINVGQFTSRNGIESTPIDGGLFGKPTQGWYLKQLTSLYLPNGRAVAKGIRA
jgi:hypothetical protein